MAIGGITYGTLNIVGLTNVIVEPLSIITSWLRLPAVTIIPLVFGFLQKDLTGAMLLSVLGREISLVLTPLQIYTFGVAATIGIPCIIALGMLIREFGFKKAIVLTGASVTYGLFFAGSVGRIISIFWKGTTRRYEAAWMFFVSSMNLVAFWYVFYRVLSEQETKSLM